MDKKNSGGGGGIGFVGLLTIVFITLKLTRVIAWSWWWVLAPFAVAAAWWAWADATGYTKRKAMEKMDQRKQDRITKQKESLGMKARRPR